MATYEEKFRNMGVKDPKAIKELADWHRATKALVKPNESFRDKIHRWVTGRSGMWYMVRADEVKRGGDRISISTVVCDPHIPKFRIAFYGLGFPPKSPLLCEHAQLEFASTLQEAKERHKDIVRRIKNGATFEEIKGKDNWEW